MTEIENWLVMIVLVPIIAGLFKAEIGKLLTALILYIGRIYHIGDTGELYNSGNGEWDSVVVIDFKFSLSRKKRGIFIQYENGMVEQMSVVAWRNGMRKRR